MATKSYAKWYRENNREAYNAAKLDWANKNRAKRTIQARNSYLFNKYGITDDEYTKMYKKQNGKCAICFKEIFITLNRKGNSSNSCHLDHNHVTNKIRGMLCHSCNNALGHFRDDIKVLKSAIKYLNYYNKIKKNEYCIK